MDAKTDSYLAQVVKLGYPLLAGMFAEYLMYIADSIMVGRLGTAYLAAVAIGGLVVEILWVFAWTVAPGVQTICSRRFGMQDRRSAEFTGEVFNVGLIFGVAAGLMTLAASFASKAVISSLVESRRTVILSMDYIRIIRWSIPVSAIFYTIYGFLAGINKTKQVMYATIGTNVLNVILNFILIFGKLGFPALGIRGAAWGTLVAQVAGLLYFALIIVIPREYRMYRLFSFTPVTMPLIGDITRTWLPLCIQYVFSFTIFLLYEGFVSDFGPAHLAAIHIVFSLFLFGKTIAGGFADGAAILVGNSLGRDDRKAAVRYTNVSMAIGAVIGCITLILARFTPALIVKIFNSEIDTLAAGTRALRFFSVFFLPGIFSHSIEMIFTHNGWSSFVFFSDAACNSAFTLGFTLIAVKVFQSGVRIVWLGYAFYVVVFTALLVGGYFSMRWTRLRVDRAA
jgi:MATE family multidrug resistance protein